MELELAPFCLARCCETFHIGREQLEWLENEPENVADGPFIRDMLIPVSHADAQANHRRWGLVNWKPEIGESYFTCRHWDKMSRLCTVYEERPEMCRGYGNGQSCKHGCGL